MQEVTRSDLFIIYKAAAQMSAIDSNVADQERLFLEKLAHAAGLSSSEIKKLQSAVNEDVGKLAAELSSIKAKKTFLLAVATMAKADQRLGREELELLKRLTLKLEIGRVKIDEMSYEACENMVFKLLNQTNTQSRPDPKDIKRGENFSDLDTL
ncbi:MAG: TerB family tellurite resistance protein [SAR324 cluster bacterium]|nr:TerB family tellurite resistance protein [SAR324 cluster bacterium]